MEKVSNSKINNSAFKGKTADITYYNAETDSKGNMYLNFKVVNKYDDSITVFAENIFLDNQLYPELGVHLASVQEDETVFGRVKLKHKYFQNGIKSTYTIGFNSSIRNYIYKEIDNISVNVQIKFGDTEESKIHTKCDTP